MNTGLWWMDVLKRHSALSKGKKIIALIEKNLSNKEIASVIHMSLPTVETHRKNISANSDCNNTPLR